MFNGYILFIDILLLFLYELNFYEFTSRVYEILTSLRKYNNHILFEQKKIYKRYMWSPKKKDKYLFFLFKATTLNCLYLNIYNFIIVRDVLE